MPEVPISKISENPFNSRIRYSDSEIRQLADSMSTIGLLSPVLVRPKRKSSAEGGEEGFELVFGHRRLRAARLLKWENITADIRELSDVEIAQLSLSENLVRSDLSDYEKALCFARMNQEFGMSQEEIGRIAGLSRTHICNYIRMLSLVDRSILEKDKALRERLHAVSEHHARIILNLKDPDDRIRAINLVASERMSVQDLHRVIHRFRGWFDTGASVLSGEGRDDDTVSTEIYPGGASRESQEEGYRSKDIQQIRQILNAECELPHGGDFHSFAKLHDIENGFSIYSSFSPESRQEGSEAMTTIRNWFYNVAPQFSVRIRDLHVRFYGGVALATFYADFAKQTQTPRRMKGSRGTVVLIHRSNGWKIVHEHWSRTVRSKVASKSTKSGRPCQMVLPGQRST